MKEEEQILADAVTLENQSQAAAAAEAAAFVEACPLAGWQLAVKATASTTAKEPAHFCIIRFVCFINYI